MRGIVLALAIGAAVALLSLLGFSLQHAVLLGIVAFLVTLWTNEALPLGVVSLLPILLFPSFGILPTNDVTPNYAKSIIFLFLGGFMLAIAIEKTGLHRYFSAKLLSFFPQTARGMIYATAITSALLSAFLSNTTITLMLMPVAMHLSTHPKMRTRLLLSTAYGASIGGILTPIGTPPNLILLGFLEDHHLPQPAFGEWMLYMLPIIALMLLFVPFFLSRDLADVPLAKERCEVPVLDTKQKRLFAIFLSLAALLLLNTFSKRLFGMALNEKLLLLGFGLLMFMPKIGFLSWEDARKIPYEIIFLFGAGFSIAAAFSHSGLAAEIAQKLAFITDLPLWAMLLVAVAFVTFATEVTSNTALISVALPIFYAFAQELPPNEGTLLLMSTTVAASYAFMLPIATPPNAIVMSSGAIRMKEMAQKGFWLNIVGIVTLTLCASMIWKHFV